MELNNLTPAAGSVKTAKRVGRGAGVRLFNSIMIIRF